MGSNLIHFRKPVANINEKIQFLVAGLSDFVSKVNDLP